MGIVILELTRSGEMTEPVETKAGTKAKGEWGTLKLIINGKTEKTYDTIERRGKYVALPKGDYLVKKHYAKKIGSLKNFEKYLKDNIHNSLWPQVVTDDGGTPEDLSDDKAESLKGKRGAILIHPANTAAGLEGCAAPGTRRSKSFITDTVKAMAEIFTAMGNFPIAQLKVTNDITDN